MTDTSSSEPTFWQQHWRATLFGVIAIAAALRLYALARHSIWYDESTSLFALRYVDWKLTFLRPGDETRLIPFNTLLLFFWHRMVGALPGVELGTWQSDYLLRLLPAILGLLTVPLTFALGRRVAGRTAAGLIAAFLVAISPFHIYYAQELRPHTLYALLVLAAMYCNYRALEDDRPRYWIGSVAFAALSFYAYYFSVFYMAAVNLYVFLLWRHYRPVLRKWILSQVAVGVLMLPAVILALAVFMLHAGAKEHWFEHPSLKTLFITVKVWFAGYSPNPNVYWPLLILAGFAFLAGLAALARRPRQAFFLLMMAFAPLVIQWLFWMTQNFSFYTMRIQLAYSLPGFVLAGAGLSAPRLRWARIAVLGLIVALTVPALADYYAQRIHPMIHHRIGARYKVDNRSAAHYIQQHWHEGDAVAHASTVTLGPFLYHYLKAPQAFAGFGEQEWKGHIASFPDEELWKSLGFQPRRVEDLLTDARRVWLVTAWWEPKEHFPHATALRAWFDQQGVRMDYQYFDGVQLYLFDLAPAARERATVDWVSDLGWYETPRIVLPGEGRTIEPGIDPEQPFPPMAAQDPSGLDVWFEDMGESAAQPDVLSFPVHFRNRSLVTRPLELRVRDAAAFYASLSFQREPGDETWRPSRTHFGKMAYHAALAEDGAASISKAPGLTGSYDLYVQMYTEGGESNAKRGALHVDMESAGGGTTRIATMNGHIPGAATGWRWLRAGTVQLAEDSTIVLTAANPDRLDYAVVDIDHIALAPAGSGSQPWSGVALVEGALEPAQEATIDVRIPRSELLPGARVLLFEVLDAEYHVYRSLLRHTDAP